MVFELEFYIKRLESSIMHFQFLLLIENNLQENEEIEEVKKYVMWTLPLIIIYSMQLLQIIWLISLYLCINISADLNWRTNQIYDRSQKKQLKPKITLQLLLIDYLQLLKM